MKKKGLGSGLSSLLSDDEAVIEVKAGDRAPVLVKTVMLEPKKSQPRKKFNKEALAELADSITVHGIIQPLAVRPLKNGFYQIISGERRWRAARMAGLDELPVIIKDVDDLTSAEMSLVENLQREDLDPVEEAMGYKYLSDQYALTQEEIARRVAKSRSVVANSLRILSLGRPILDMLAGGEISTGHARAILPLPEEERLELAKKIALNSMSVRETERAVKNRSEKKTLVERFMNSGESGDYGAEAETADPPERPQVSKRASENRGRAAYTGREYYSALQTSLSEASGIPIKIKAGGIGGVLSINYADSPQLEAILRKILGDEKIDEIFSELS